MKVPRDLSGRELAKALQVLGYRVTRQSGSHIRLTTTERGEHHVTVPDQSYFDQGIVWYENQDGAGNFGPGEVIFSDVLGDKSVVAANGDGRTLLVVLGPQSRRGPGRGRRHRRAFDPLVCPSKDERAAPPPSAS